MLESEGEKPLAAMHRSMDEVMETQRKSLAIPRRLDGNIKELWLTQSRFAQRTRGKAFRLLAHPRFRACYDFYALRAEAGDAEPDIAAWWEKFQVADEATREKMLLADEPPKKKRRRRRGGRGPSPSDPSVESAPPNGDTP